MTLQTFFKENKPNLKQSSIDLYKNRLNLLYKAVLNKKAEPRSVRFLYLNVNEIVDFIENSDKATTSKQSYFSICALSLDLLIKKTPLKKIKEAYDIYKTYADKYKGEYEAKIKSGKPTDKQQKNYISLKELLQYANNLDDVEYKAVALLSLNYTLRNDLRTLLIISNTEYDNLSKAEQDKNNYIVFSVKGKIYIVLNNYKTNKHYGQIKINIEDATREAVFNYLQSLMFEGIHPFLTTKRGKPYTDKNFSEYIKRVFKGTGKNLTTTALRHIKISDTLGEQHKKNKALAKQMLHSVDTQKNYIINYE